MIPRIGIGYDVHQLKAGERLLIGGIEIPHTKGALGHSDADALIHAICDALLGAAGLGDIGKHFPDTDVNFKGIDSSILLKRTVSLLQEKDFRIGNVDSVVVLQQPKIAPYIPQMLQKLSAIMGIGEDDVSVKATTTEKLGFEGREEGIAAHAAVVIYKVSTSVA